MTERNPGNGEHAQDPLSKIARRIQIREQRALHTHGITPEQQREVTTLANLSLLAIAYRAPGGLTARIVREFVQYSTSIIRNGNIK